MGQRVPGDPDHAEDVDVEDPVPFGVVVVLDGADGADARVGDHGVQGAEFAHGPGDRVAYARVVGDVGLQDEGAGRGALHVPVEHGDAGAALHQELGDGGADARGAARDKGRHVLEVPCAAHELTSWAGRRASHCGPSG